MFLGKRKEDRSVFVLGREPRVQRWSMNLRRRCLAEGMYTGCHEKEQIRGAKGKKINKKERNAYNWR